MGTTVYHLPIDTNTPGVSTKVVQEINFSELSSKEFNRIVNAAKSGVVTGDGWVSALLTTLAKRHNLSPPIVVRNSFGVYLLHPNINAQPFEALATEIMAVSDVREQFNCSRSGRKPQVAMRSKRLWPGESISLVGWGKSIAPLTRELRTRVKDVPWFVENNKRLVALLMQKPTVTIITTL